MFSDFEGKTNLDQDENWRTLVKTRIDYFLSTLEPDQCQQLDYSIESLDVFNRWFLNRYKYREDLWDDEDDAPVFFHGAMFYVGETYRKHLGGYWSSHYTGTEASFLYEDGPVIEGFFEDYPLCPWDDFYYVVNDRDDTWFRDKLTGTIKYISQSGSS